MNKTIKLTHPLPDGTYAFNYKTFQIYITFVYISKANMNMNYFQVTGTQLELERLVSTPELFEYYNDTFMGTTTESPVEDVVESSKTTMEVELNGQIIKTKTPVVKPTQETHVKTKQFKRSSSNLHQSRTTRKNSKKKKRSAQ